jgi:hypothetical protein
MTLTVIVNGNGTIMLHRYGEELVARQHDAEYDVEPYTKNIIEIEE